MTDPYYSDDSVTLWHGDTLEVLRTMPDASVDCAVTSPPYYGLRDYGEPGQYGLESTPAEYVETMRAVFAEVRRVLAVDGTLWLNLGDSYAGSAAGGPPSPSSTLRGNGHVGGGPKQAAGAGRPAAPGVPAQRSAEPPAKNLLGIPWRVAFALQDDGWILRKEIIWHKSNAMPESVRDRPSSTHEALFLFAKSQRYWFDLDPIREPHVYPEDDRVLGRVVRGEIGQPQHSRMGVSALGRNPGDVWEIEHDPLDDLPTVWKLPSQPFAEAHFAVMPKRLAERCILAGCRPGGTVLDPFAGSCTTGMVAGQHGRRFVGIDLSAKYLDLALSTRLAQGVLLEDVV